MTTGRDKLLLLENVIDQGRRGFYEAGRALKRIRDEKLYKVALFDSFECYVRRRWEMGKSQAYRLIEAGVVVKNLS
ncbi:MAG: DNA methylase, partial [Proteobacteria bacterium]|nr:DNA methylase [Pseudomonadota bacterium]